jgi:Tol biopolymer transport system component
VGRLLLAIPLAALVGAGLASAGSYTPPPGDCCPQWSPKGTQIVFTTGRPKGKTVVGAVSSAGGAEQLISGIPVGARSPDWKHVAFEKNGSLAVANDDGTNEKLLAPTNGDFTWSPNSARLAFVGKDGSLSVIGVDGTGLAKIASGPQAGMPSWSPNGARIAYVKPLDNGNVHVVNAGGGGDAVLAGPAGAIEPMWAPDSARISFLYASSIVVVRLGGAGRTYALPQPALFNNGWFPDGKALLYDAEPMLPPDVPSAEIGTLVHGQLFQDALVRLDVKTGKRSVFSFGDGAAFSNDGKRVAFSSGGECRDRAGIYVMRTNGTGRKRLTNDCSIRGTGGTDTLHGTPQADVLLGQGGNDRLVASDPGYVGDTLDGGPGNDVLVGDFQQDTLSGGPGGDNLAGGASADTLVGGPGRDRIFGNGGRDTIYAVDGQRDAVSCGSGRDVVYADRIDVVNSDCEVVHRS